MRIWREVKNFAIQKFHLKPGQSAEMPERIAPEPLQSSEVAGHVQVGLKLKSLPVAYDASKSYETQGSRTHGCNQDKLTNTNS